LNSIIVKSFVNGYAIGTQIGTHITEYIIIPQFDSNDNLHKELSLISSKIFKEKRDAKPEEISRMEEIIESILVNI